MKSETGKQEEQNKENGEGISKSNCGSLKYSTFTSHKVSGTKKEKVLEYLEVF